MRPLPNFTMYRPAAVTEALQMIKEFDEAKVIAGGTDLLLVLRDRTCKAKNLVDLSLIKELSHIRQNAGKICIGATTTLNMLQQSDLIRQKAPALAEAAGCVGSAQIRNLGTLGGNLCNASPAADTAPPLLALDAEVEIASHNQLRRMPLDELFAGPKLNSLKPFELLTEINFPVPPRGAGTSFQKLGRRKGYTLSLVNASAYLQLNRETCHIARLALGAVGSTPLRMVEAEKILRDKEVSAQLIKDAASVCTYLVSPVTDVRASAEYRREMSCVLMRRALTEAWERARRSL